MIAFVILLVSGRHPAVARQAAHTGHQATRNLACARSECTTSTNTFVGGHWILPTIGQVELPTDGHTTAVRARRRSQAAHPGTSGHSSVSGSSVLQPSLCARGTQAG